MACQFPEGAVIRHVFGNVTVDLRVIVVPPSHTTFLTPPRHAASSACAVICAFSTPTALDVHSMNDLCSCHERRSGSTNHTAWILTDRALQDRRLGIETAIWHERSRRGRDHALSNEQSDRTIGLRSGGLPRDRVFPWA
jgi:hypothetical protein